MGSIEEKLTGGHPNSLGNTIEVVESVLAKPDQFQELFDCYFSEDEVVRLRVSNAMKRICRERKELLLPYLNRFLVEISLIDQASTQWTLAQLYKMLEAEMTSDQLKIARQQLINNLKNHNDWIVLNMTMDTLTHWALKDDHLKKVILPHLHRLSGDSRKSVASKANKMLVVLE